MAGINVLIAVPAYRGTIAAETATCLVQLSVALLKENSTAFSLLIAEMGDIEQARNRFASIALNKGFSHVLFIDNDMIFKPGVILKLLRANRDVIGCACPIRGQAGELLYAITQFGNGTPEPDGTLRVSYIGTAILLVSATSLTKLVRTEKLRTLNKGTDGGPEYGFFDRIARDDGARESEDYAFCDRWLKLCGGEVYAVIDEEIGHIGKMIHRGRWIDDYERSNPRE